MKIVEVKEGNKIKDYDAYVSLHTLVKEFQAEAKTLVPKLEKLRQRWIGLVK